MKNIFSIFLLIIVSACTISPSQRLTTQSTSTPKVFIIASPISAIPPAEIYLIPDTEPPPRIFASLPISELIGLEDEAIALLLLEKFLNQQMRDDTEINKIIDYEIVDFTPQFQRQGRFYACYIMTPASKTFVMNNSWELEDGRIETCNVFGVSKSAELYYLSGYYGG